MKNIGEERKQKYQINFSKLREVIRDPRMKPMEKCIVVNLLTYAGLTGKAFPSEVTIANDLGCSDRYVRVCLKNIKLKGWITDWKKRGYSKSNSYIFNKELYFLTTDKSNVKSSPQIGNTVPIQNGSEMPPKEVPIDSQGSSKLQPLYEKALDRSLSGTELKRLVELCISYSEEWVRDAINVAINRGKKEFNTSYLRFILEDWKKFGKAPPKPIFTPCNIPPCDYGGYWNPARGRVNCECKVAYLQKIRELKNIWGEEYGDDGSLF